MKSATGSKKAGGERKMKNENNKIIVIHESVFVSWLKDIFTFGMIGLLLYSNEHFFGGNGGVAVVLVLMAIVLTCGKLLPNHFYSKEDAKKYIDDL